MASTDPLPQKNGEPEYDAGHVPITEEFDSAKHTLPSVGPVVIAMVFVAVCLAIAAYVFRARPAVSGSIDDAYAIEVPNQNTVLATVQLTIRNITQKPVTLKTVHVTIKTPDGELTDEAGSVADFERYAQAFPELRSHITQGLARETKIPPGQQLSGTVVVGFPTTAEKFNARQQTRAQITLYDHSPVEITR